MKKWLMILSLALYCSVAVEAGYAPSPAVSYDTWQQVEPYLLPEDHPAKKVLDKAFSSPAPLASIKALKKAGFRCKKPRKSGMIVARHKKLKGYLIKAYLHSDVAPETYLWLKRIQGSELVRSSITKHRMSGMMKVPRKWIYPIPCDGREPHKDFILVVEDMGLVSSSTNAYCYKMKVGPQFLDGLYAILSENSLFDSIYIDNIPYCQDGKIAFLDTEHYSLEGHEVRYDRLTPCFSKEMQQYWNWLISR